MNAPEQFDDHVGWVRMLAHKIRRSWSVDIDDLVQVGLIALWRVAKRFDPTRGVKFRTFAQHRVVGDMLTAVRDARNPGRDWILASQVDWHAPASDRDSVIDTAAQTERAVLLRTRVERLPARRRAVMLGALAGRSLQADALLLGIHWGTVSNLRVRAEADLARCAVLASSL